MRKFIIDESFWELFPHTVIGVVTCQGIDNTGTDSARYGEMLLGAEKKCLQQLEGIEDIKEHRCIAVWRQALKAFKAEKGMRSSIEALTRRVLKGNSINSINPIVDIYNSVSLSYLMPCGGEDLDSIQGNLVLTRASGDESFIPLGEEANTPPDAGEVIYRDDAGAAVRGWLWRESDRTKITEATKNAVLFIELLDPERAEEHKKAMESLADKVTAYLGGKCRIDYLNKNKKEIELVV